MPYRELKPLYWQAAKHTAIQFLILVIGAVLGFFLCMGVLGGPQ